MKGMLQKYNKLGLEKELNELLSKKNELKSTKEASCTNYEELKFKLNAAKERLQ